MDARTNRAYEWLLTQLQEVCATVLEEEPWAVEQFFGVPQDDEPTEETYYGFLDWLAFNYRDWEGRTVLERLAASTSHQDSAARQMLAAWQGSHPGFYQVQAPPAAEAGRFLMLQDLFTQQIYPVPLEWAPADVQPGDLLMTRLLPVGESYRFGFDVQVGSGSLAPAVRRIVEMELVRMQRQVPGATVAHLFAERWPLIREAMVTPMLLDEALRLAPGENGPASLGITSPPPDATPLEREAEGLLQDYLMSEDYSRANRIRAVQLWWDAAAVLRPRTGGADGWAAGAAYAFTRYVLQDDLTQQDVADWFGITASTVGVRARTIADALQLETFDARYMDPLDSRVRIHMHVLRLGARFLQAAQQAAQEAAAAIAAHPSPADRSEPPVGSPEREAMPRRRDEIRTFSIALDPASPLYDLLATRDLHTLQALARSLGIKYFARYRKPELARLVADAIERDPAAAYAALNAEEQALVRSLLEAGAPVPWQAFCRRWNVIRHPRFDERSPLYQPWASGLVHVGTTTLPDGTKGPAVFVPHVLAERLRDEMR
jgi:hypothetical protein